MKNRLNDCKRKLDVAALGSASHKFVSEIWIDGKPECRARSCVEEKRQLKREKRKSDSGRVLERVHFPSSFCNESVERLV